MAKGGGKGKAGATGKIENASQLRAGAGKKKGEPKMTMRIANAKELRAQFAEVHRSPDGADPQPLTVPKCVECAHCGWPVYPRESRVATRKTFERAGIQRDFGDKMKAKEEKLKADKEAKAAGGGAAAEEEEDLDIGDEDDDDGAGSEDSVGTVEVLQTKVDELEEEVADLKSQNNSLEQEVADLNKQVEDLEEALAAAEEKIELLEESEMRWREKNSALRVENEELRLVIDRLGARVGDLETDMVKKLLEIRKYKEDEARFNRRRTLMLKELEAKLRRMAGSEAVKALFKLWQEDTARENLRRVKQEAEERRRLEVSELRDQLTQEKEHVLSLEATATRLRGNLKAAAQRLLMKVFSTTQKPWADGHALTVWCGTHETLKFENELIRTQEELKETQDLLAKEEALTKSLSATLEETTNNLKTVTRERDELAQNLSSVMTELQSTLGNMGQHASDVQKMAEDKAKAARDALIADCWAEAQAKMDAMNKAFEEEKLRLEDQVAGLEAQLESIKRGLAMEKGEGDDTRVVPKGQGIMCCGCLRQIVNRGVKQLPPVSMPKPKSPRREEKMRKTFFEKELVGMPDPDDFLHSEVWSSRRDPLKGLRYADISPEVSWMGSTTSTKAPGSTSLAPGSTSLPSLSRMKHDKIFNPRAFR